MSDINIGKVYNRSILTLLGKRPDEINEIVVNGVKYPIGHLDVDSRWDLQVYLKRLDYKVNGGNNDDILSEDEQKKVNTTELEKIIYYNPRVAHSTKTPPDILKKIALYRGEDYKSLHQYLFGNARIKEDPEISLILAKAGTFKP